MIVTSLHEAPALYDEMDLFVSILDPGYRKFPLKGERDKHYIARFEDTEHPKEKDWMKMNREVRGILAWIKGKNPTLDTKILVHCHAGVSRSSATAWLIQVMLGQDPLEAFQKLLKARPQIWPNKVVLGIGADYLKLGPDFMKLVERVDAEIAGQKREYLGYGS